MLRLLAAAALTLTSLAHAQSAGGRSMEVLTNTNIETIRPVLRNAGLRPERMEFQGRDALVLQDNGDTVILHPRVCAPQCTGLLMLVLLEGAAPASAINAFNQQTPATVAYTSGNATILSRYLIADHGITEGTFLVNLDVFKQTVRKWTQSRNSRNAMSVSLMTRSVPAEVDAETEELLQFLRTRPDLVSGQIIQDY